MAVLELDRVLDGSPDELDQHRLGLQAARQDRLALISECTERSLVRMETAASAANLKVLLHPSKAPALVQASNEVSGSILDFHGRLGLGGERASLEARRWRVAASEVRDRALEQVAERVEAAKRAGNQTYDRARSTAGDLSRRLAEQAKRRRATDDEMDEPET